VFGGGGFGVGGRSGGIGLVCAVLDLRSNHDPFNTGRGGGLW
jgi:hypothetical protein